MLRQARVQAGSWPKSMGQEGERSRSADQSRVNLQFYSPLGLSPGPLTCCRLWVPRDTIDRSPEGSSSMKTNRLLVTAVLATVLAPMTGFGGDINVAQPTTSPGVRVPFLHGLPTSPFASQSELASLERADEWLNSPPLTASALRGKVVLIDFWTYTCINWRRTLPYVRAWAAKYRAQGLVVIGVHAPEFAFEKYLNNVRWAVEDMRIGYPVAVDNDHAIWRAFYNHYRPALYFIDANGLIRHRH